MKRAGRWVVAAIAVMSDEDAMTVQAIEQSIRERRLYFSTARDRVKTLRAQLDNYCINAGSPQRPGPPYYFERVGERFLLHPGPDLAQHFARTPSTRFPTAISAPFGVEQVFPPLPEEIVTPKLFLEGATTTIAVNRFERSAEARHMCIDHHGCKCSVCDFDFLAVYGEIGRNFIHVHHLRGLADIGVAYHVDPIFELRPVCPNCHAMIHRTDPPLTIEALRAVIKERRQIVGVG